MSRIDKACCGDCAQCALLAEGRVDMIPCALDQLMRRVQVLGEAVARLSAKIDKIAVGATTPALAAVEVEEPQKEKK